MEFPTKKHLRNGVLSAARKELCGEYSEHSHEFFEMEYMIDGSGQYVVDDVSYPIRKGALFFMTPVSFHRVATPGAEIFNVMFSFDLCDTEMLLDRFANHTAVIAQLSPEDQRLVESLMTEMTVTTHLPYAIQCLRCLIYKLTFLDQEQAALSPHVRRAVAYLLEHFREPISRQAMAREVYEELGIRIPKERFKKLAVYGEPGRIAAYCDGSVWRMVIVVFELELEKEPEIVISAESRAMRFFTKEELKDIDIVITHSDIVEDWFLNR